MTTQSRTWAAAVFTVLVTFQATSSFSSTLKCHAKLQLLNFIFRRLITSYHLRPPEQFTFHLLPCFIVVYKVASFLHQKMGQIEKQLKKETFNFRVSLLYRKFAKRVLIYFTPICPTISIVYIYIYTYKTTPYIFIYIFIYLYIWVHYIQGMVIRYN